ncbi:MAG TPA: aconitate hydratase AcnA, partial [Polyangiaceae bacterium]
GFRLYGLLPEGATATDLVLTVTKMLRDRGVVGKFVEFYGEGLDNLPLADRATIANMSPEFGSTCAIFPIDGETLRYVRLTGRSEERAELIEAYAKAQGLFRTNESPEPKYADTLELNLRSVVPALAGPKRPQDKVLLSNAGQSWKKALGEMLPAGGKADAKVSCSLNGDSFALTHGSVVIAAITSCTNTSNPSVMVAAGLLARNAVRLGLCVKPWVKTSLAPGSKVVTRYLSQAGLLQDLESLNFHLVGYGCTTCIGNSGPLAEPISRAIQEGNLVAVSVLSGNRNFEGRISPEVRANYLASPPLVVAYALAGRMDIDFANEPIGEGRSGNPVLLKDIWPSPEEVQQVLEKSVSSGLFKDEYNKVYQGDERWRALPVPEGSQFEWAEDSTYVRAPTFFENMAVEPEPLRDIQNARVLVMLGDSVTTDHISPAGSIHKDSPAGRYLMERGVQPNEFNSYGSRRGNHEVMMRGTFANVRLRNLLAPDTEGGWTRHFPGNAQQTIFDASEQYAREGVPLLVIAGKEYGSGSSRDWAAKGTRMLGVLAVIAESFERIHRSNLIGMGVLPLEFLTGQNRQSLGLTGEETYRIEGIAEELAPGKRLRARAANNGTIRDFELIARIDTAVELDY